MRLKSIIFTIFLCLILCLSSWGYQYYTVTNLSLTTATAVGPYRFQPSQARNVGITDYTSLLTDFTFYVSSGRLVVTGPYTISGTEPILYHPHQGIVQGQDLGTVAWYNAPLAVAYGGTAANTATDARTNLGISAGSLLPTSIQGDMIYASAVDTWIILSKSTSATRYLSNTGANNNPAWAQVALGTGVSGVLPIANGGTNKSSWTQWGIPYADTTTSLAQIAAGSAGQVLQSNGNAAPGWETLEQADVTGLTTVDSPTFAGVTVGNTGLQIKDTGADHTLALKPNENLTGNKTLNLITGDADRTITLSGNPTLNNWFDQEVKTTSTPTFNAVQSVMFAGLYNRERSDKWAIKSYTTAAERYILQTPTNLGVYLNGKVYVVSAKTDYDLSVTATWDSIDPDYRIAATRAGKDFYVYAVEAAGNTLSVLISANASAPAGYTTTTSRLIGGFHCLCLSVGAITGHTLTNFATGDILPNSVWDYNFRPLCAPQGMVFSPMANLWVDIYLASGTGVNTKSVFGGVISDTRDWNSFVDDGGAVYKRLLYDPEFQLIATGSNEETNIAGSADPVTTGGHTDTAGRRMIANNGCEDCCGVSWQWLIDQSFRYDGGGHTHNNTITFRNPATGAPTFKLNGETKLNAVTDSGADEVITNTSVDPAPAWAYYNLPGVKGSLYRQGTYGDVKLLAGAAWGSVATSGSRARGADNYRWDAAAAVGGRFACEPLNR